MENVTFAPSEFILDCLNHSDHRSLITAILFFIYLVTVTGNVLVILVIILDHQLQTPMYLYIGILACIDLISSTNIIPKMLSSILYDRVVPKVACFVQLYILHHLEVMQTFLLTFMAYDRYVAVVNPLRYPSIITTKTVLHSLLVSSACAFFLIAPFAFICVSFPIYRTNVLPYCLCDYVTILRVACVDYVSYLIPGSTVSVLMLFFPLSAILFSYSKIVQAVLKISSNEGRRKAFSTCLTHLMIVSMFYVPLFTAYVFPSTGITVEEYNVIAIIPCIIPPMFNPIIYSFRNKEMKNGILKLLCKRKTVPESNKH
ncbi:olfactory receptor 2T2-like [Erpetoichthys calabaricus]|uniref:olfactory receptor 2T2-like n=1 Tax=Erpetoichthys calabaricus TaxID=27687 RepID=UPI002234877E|nr:olfactory receptor 2T2-like [Erpetoichthys calabaricus]